MWGGCYRSWVAADSVQPGNGHQYRDTRAHSLSICSPFRQGKHPVHPASSDQISRFGMCDMFDTCDNVPNLLIWSEVHITCIVLHWAGMIRHRAARQIHPNNSDCIIPVPYSPFSRFFTLFLLWLFFSFSIPASSQVNDCSLMSFPT